MSDVDVDTHYGTYLPTNSPSLPLNSTILLLRLDGF